MKTALCTISTQSHLFKSFALLDAVAQYSTTDLCCLVTDANHHQLKGGVVFHHLNDLTYNVAQTIQQKYTNDKLRWSLKPVYVHFLLEQGYDRVIYVDNDIFFYSSPDFLFEKLKTADFLLTPHFYKANPKNDQNWLEANFRVGLYNAGFFGANKNAIPILEWWANCCLYAMSKSYWRGLYDDQKYLDLIPIQFDNVEIVKHRGCNFAGWNCDDGAMEMKDNYLHINGDSLVFIHFAALSMQRFSKNDSVVFTYYQKYIEKLQHYHPRFENSAPKITFLTLSNYWYYLKWQFIRYFAKN